MIDFATCRLNMVESQIRPNGITDSRLIAAMAEVPRELFVTAERVDLAYMDEDVLIGRTGDVPRFLMEPMAFARLVQLADIGPTDHVLDLGCGTGYGTAVLAKLAAKVTAYDCDEALAGLARQNLGKIGVLNAQVAACGNLSDGPAGGDVFDVIFVNGRVLEHPTRLAQRLKDAGRMVSVEGALNMGRAWLTSKHDGALSRRAAFDASVPLLPGFAPSRPAFVF